MITREQWGEAAEREAAKVYGRRHATLYSVRHYAPAYLALAGIAAAGYGAWWLWHQLMTHLNSAGTATLPGTIAHSGVPAWVIVAAVLLLVPTLVLFRPGRIDRTGVLVAKWMSIPVAWLFLIGFTVSAALG